MDFPRIKRAFKGVLSALPGVGGAETLEDSPEDSIADFRYSMKAEKDWSDEQFDLIEDAVLQITGYLSINEINYANELRILTVPGVPEAESMWIFQKAVQFDAIGVFMTDNQIMKNRLEGADIKLDDVIYFMDNAPLEYQLFCQKNKKEPEDINETSWMLYNSAYTHDAELS